MMWGSGLEDGNKHRRENLPFIIAGKGWRIDQDRTFPDRTPRATRATFATKQINEIKGLTEF